MTSEIFRFANLRKSRSKQRDGDTGGGIILQASREPTPFQKELLGLKRNRQPRSAYEAAAQRYRELDQYALSARPLPVAINLLDKWLRSQGEHLSRGAFLEGVRNSLGDEVETIVESESYATTRARLSDSLMAHSILPDFVEDKKQISRWMRIAGLLERVCNSRVEVIVQERVFTAPVLLPKDVFPIPRTENPHDEQVKKAAEEERKRYEKARQETIALAGNIGQYRHALQELATAMHTDSNELRKEYANGGSEHAQLARAAGNSTNLPRPGPIGRLTVPVLSKRAVNALSPATKTVLQKFGVSKEFVDVPYATRAIEAAIADDSSRLFHGSGSHTISRVGNQWIPTTDLDGLVSDRIDDYGEKMEPGPCLPPAPQDPIVSQPTVPDTTISPIRPIGIADLLQVRQKVKRYALGEIAHIENVMRSENRGRRHSQTTRVTETLVVETERTKEETRDLQTAERFELQQEIDKVVQEESSREVGLSVSASYGPFEGSANINTAQSNSKEETTKSATRFSREVTDKAVKKIQERVLETRTTTTETEVQEINKHNFDNSEGSEHLQGIYRWVDKVYEAQVVSYGLRTMFEFIVPEPAAFYKYASSVMPREWQKVECPIPPGYCHLSTQKFTPLLPSDLNEGTYQFWVGAYGVTGVQPPPPLSKIVSISMAEEAPTPAGVEGTLIASMNNEMQVPEGYQAERAFVNGYFQETNDPNDFTNFHVGRTFLTINSAGPMNHEDGTIPVVAHGYSYYFYSVTIEVLCMRTKEALESWQLETYNAIMAAYNELKSQYETALARLEANIQNGIMVYGRNPLTNRDIERTELKRASLSLLTGQHFDDFDAMRRGVPPHGYPQMDLAEVQAESGYIQFFEQAFEWSNMSYLFYPYFWGQKSEWPITLKNDDNDPPFARFLQAGAARVQVPVRPGYEGAVAYLLDTGNKPWEVEDHAYTIEGSLFVSIIKEIKEEELGAFTKGAGTLAVVQGSDTITGTDTAFDEDLHTDRDINILERTYRVARVKSPTEIVLDRPYQDVSKTGVPYAFGARLVGDPWEVRVPTQLVYLQADSELPDLIE
jgi:hypothetical protein